MKKPTKAEAAGPLFVQPLEGEIKVGDKVTHADKSGEGEILSVSPTRRTKAKDKAIEAQVAEPPRNMPALISSAPPPAQRAEIPKSSFDDAGFFAMIERVMGNPQADVDKLDRLLAMRVQMIERQAKADFDAHFVDMQNDLPQITKDGRIVAEGVSRTSGKEYKQNTAYAKYETIMKGVLPVVNRHGFTVTHETETMPDKTLKITAVIKGYGHTERPCSIILQNDSTGSKNNAQGWVSAMSYGRRATASAALNLVIVGEDDDGNASGKPQVVGDAVSEEQAMSLIEFCEAAELTPASLLAFMNKKRPRGHPEAERIADLPSFRYEEAVSAIRRYEADKSNREGKH